MQIIRGLLPLPLLRRSKRGAALIVTVLVSAVAASIALVVITQAVRVAQTEARRGGVQDAQETADAAVRSLTSDLRDDPTAYLSTVRSDESPRVCTLLPDRPVVQPGQAWPKGCGTTWDYEPSQGDGTHVQLTSPSASNPLLQARVFTRDKNLVAGRSVTYRLADAGRYALWTQGDLDLGRLVDTRSSALVEGSVYSGGALLADHQGLSVRNAQLLGERSVQASVADDVRVYVPGPKDTSQLEIRSVVPSVPSASVLVTGGRRLVNIACDEGSTGLCIRHGMTLKKADGKDAVVPQAASGYLLVEQAPTDKGRTLEVFYSDLPVSTQLPATPAHPGLQSHWRSLGVFPVPTAGVVATDEDTTFGLCGDASVTTGDCLDQDGRGTGESLTGSLTVVAGSPEAPRDLYVGSSIDVQGGSLGLVATDQLVLPYWARTKGGDLRVDASLVALGLGSPSAPSFLGTAGPATGGRLTLEGSVMAPRMDLNLPGFSSVEVRGTKDAFLTPAPYLPGSGGSWEVASTRRMTLQDLSKVAVAP